jgi:hypothetical protein
MDTPRTLTPPITGGSGSHRRAAVLVRHWPGEKSGRNEAFLALAGRICASWLGRRSDLQFSPHDLPQGSGVRLPTLARQKAEVVATYEKHSANQKVRGVPSLVSLIDKGPSMQHGHGSGSRRQRVSKLRLPHRDQ